MIEEGKIDSIVDKIYPIEQAAEAHRRVESEQRLGPVVLSLGKFGNLTNKDRTCEQRETRPIQLLDKPGRLPLISANYSQYFN